MKSCLLPGRRKLPNICRSGITGVRQPLLSMEKQSASARRKTAISHLSPTVRRNRSSACANTAGGRQLNPSSRQANEYLSEAIREMKKSLGVENGDPEHDQEENLKLESRLKSWLGDTPLYLILQWFDTIEEVRISSKLTAKRWTT